MQQVQNDAPQANHISSTSDQQDSKEKTVDHPEMALDERFIPPETELERINHSLELIGFDPFKKRNVKRTIT